MKPPPKIHPFFEKQFSGRWDFLKNKYNQLSYYEKNQKHLFQP